MSEAGPAAEPVSGPWTHRVPDIVVSGDDRADSPQLAPFFEGYDRAFVLPDEKEPLEGFRACLALNGGDFAFLRYPSREIVLVARNAGDGARLGGANFFATLVDGRIAVALNYLYVEAGYRGRGLLRTMLDATQAAARAYLGAPGAPATLFIEQNDPLKMSAASYAADSEHSGLDQVDRLTIWARAGARLVDVDYVQPALSAGQQDDRTLAYGALRHDGDWVAGSFLAAHLTGFFGISVLKGRNPMTVETARAQIEAAQGRERIALLPLLPAAMALRAQPHPQGAPSLTDLARSLAA